VATRLKEPSDLLRETLLRSYRIDDWPGWFRAAGLEPPRLTGPVFDSAALMVEAARRGHGVALAPAVLFDSEISRPFAIVAGSDGYWLTRLKSRPMNAAMAAFRDWMKAEAG